MPSATPTVDSGVVRPGELLTAAAAKRALSVGAWGWRTIGELVPKIKVGRQSYVLSDDIIDAFRKLRERNE